MPPLLLRVNLSAFLLSVPPRGKASHLVSVKIIPVINRPPSCSGIAIFISSIGNTLPSRVEVPLIAFTSRSPFLFED